MNLNRKIKNELLEAAEKSSGAEALVLLVGCEDGHSTSTMVGGASNIISLLVKALSHVMSTMPEPLGKDMRMKVAELILRGDNDASE